MLPREGLQRLDERHADRQERGELADEREHL
jgi:hypothetical protein